MELRTGAVRGYSHQMHNPVKVTGLVLFKARWKRRPAMKDYRA